MSMTGRKQVYLDYAATTPLDPEVKTEMERYFGEDFGNPSSLHMLGQRAQIAIDRAREKTAKAVGAHWREIIFTGSATEADNFAVRGVVNQIHASFPHLAPHVITSQIEHKAILETCKQLEKEGVEITYIPVNTEGIVSVEDIIGAVKPNTVLVSIMYANNEIGTIQPIKEISQALTKMRPTISGRDERLAHLSHRLPYFHTDAVQALNYLNCNVENLGVDLMSLSSHKVYGPKGIGALYARGGTPLMPLIVGGGQEYGQRSGTENVPAIMGFAKAVEKTMALQEQEVQRLRELQTHMIDGLKKNFQENVVLQGSRTNRLPNNINVRFASMPADSLLARLDQEGVFVSGGSACNARAMEPSHVIAALGVSKEAAKTSIRFTMGRHTTEKDIDFTLSVLENMKL